MTKTENNYFTNALKKSDLLLAPLAGVSDAAFRSICHECGADIMCTEMVSAKGIYYKNANTAELLQLALEEKNTGVQIFGSEEYFLKEAIKTYLNDSKFTFIDINMGCPVKKVVSNAEGSALLKDTSKLYSVAKAVVEASEKPVSAKIRIGFDAENINCVQNARALEDAGVQLITVHGRTREMFYSGQANYDAIADTVQAVDIPVVANGDVFCAEDYFRIKNHTNASGVMLARGAMGNPFLFEEIIRAKNNLPYSAPGKEEKLKTALKHLKRLEEFKGEHTACCEFRKQLCWYTKGINGGAAVRREVAKLNSCKEIEAFIVSMLG